MEAPPVKIDLPYVTAERTASGKVRYRFRRYGKKPGSPEFLDHYRDLRDGAPKRDELPAKKNSVPRLVELYLEHLEREVRDGLKSPATLKQRRIFLRQFAAAHPEISARHITDIHITDLRDTIAHKPGLADNYIKSVRAMYSWAKKRRYVAANPTDGVERLNSRTRGFAPWTPDDIRAFIKRHPPGTKANLALMLLLWTAVRRSDLVKLGHQHMTTIDGEPHLRFWQAKGGERQEEVCIWVAPPLRDALKGAGETVFLMTEHGRPYSNAGFGNRFHDWCAQAGLKGKSAHGVRKAIGGLAADAGGTQHMIMALHGHTDPRTSAIYTVSAERRVLARAGVEALTRALAGNGL